MPQLVMAAIGIGLYLIHPTAFLVYAATTTFGGILVLAGVLR